MIVRRTTSFRVQTSYFTHEGHTGQQIRADIKRNREMKFQLLLSYVFAVNLVQCVIPPLNGKFASGIYLFFNMEFFRESF